MLKFDNAEAFAAVGLGVTNDDRVHHVANLVLKSIICMRMSDMLQAVLK